MTAKEAPSHTDLMVTPESLTPWLARDGAAKTICDFMGWPEDGVAFSDAIRLAEQLGFKLLSALPPPKPSGNQEDSVSQSQPISDGHVAATSGAEGSVAIATDPMLEEFTRLNAAWLAQQAKNRDLWIALVTITGHYDARSEIYTNDADLAEAMAGIARQALRPEQATQ